MKKLLVAAAVTGVLGAGQPLLAEDGTPPDSAVVYPERVHHRSAFEQIALIPGAVLYFPPHVVGYGLKKTATLMWDDRILHRARQLLTFADGRVGVRPLGSSLSGAGVRVFVKEIGAGIDADLTSTLGASSRKRQHHLLSFDRGTQRLNVYYRSEPNAGFYGTGTDVEEGDRTSFRQRDIYVQLRSKNRLEERVRFDLDVNYHRTEISAGESKDYPPITEAYRRGALPGLEDAVDIVEVGFTARGQFVDVPGSPTRGNRTRVRFAYRQSIDDDEFSHLRFGLLSEQFMEVFYRRTVSLQIGTDWRIDAFDNDIPFYELAYLGGTEVLRGFKRGRFRDRGLAYVVGTYKFPIWELVEGTVFYESGRVFNKIGDVGLSDWETSYGGGMRVWVPEGVVFELILARGSELSRLLFSFAATF